MQTVAGSSRQVSLQAVLLGAVYAVASGVILAFALPPLDVPLLGFVAFAPLLVAALRVPRFSALGFATLSALSVAVVLTGVPFSAHDASDYLTLSPFIVFGVLNAIVLMVAQRLGTARGWATVLGVSATGVLCEWVAMLLDFPYTVAFTLWRNPLILWVAGWVGIWGLAFLVWASNTAVALAWVQRRLTQPLRVLVGVLVVLHLLGWLQIHWARPQATVRVAVLQASNNLYPELIRQAKAQGAQLVVLPEICCTPEQALDWAQSHRVWIVFGHWSERNSASLATPEGTISAPYHKMHPYGGEGRSWSPGEPVQAFASPFGTIGAVICYDTMFTEPCRQQALNGARLIAVPTFDPIVSGLAFHHLHAATTTLRAAEHRTPLARSEYRAVSMIADEWGRVLAYADAGEMLAIADVPLGSGRGTLASRVGNWFVLGYAILLLGVWRHTKRVSQTSSAGAPTR